MIISVIVMIIVIVINIICYYCSCYLYLPIVGDEKEQQDWKMALLTT